MAVKIIGTTSGIELDVLADKSLPVAEQLPVVPAAGGFYTVTGQVPAVVAAGLAANTMLASMRMVVGSSRAAYITRLRVCLSIATQGVAGGIAGVLGLQRFTAQTPTGGVARTPNRLHEGAGTASDITDIRDSNAALTGTAPTFGAIVAVTLVPLVIVLTSGMVNCGFEWIVEPPYPIRLAAGDGLALRTQQAMPATQTWVYSYTYHWFEK
jgi:hypothetical protein